MTDEIDGETMQQKHIYVFDTNVILNDPYAIFNYDNSEIVIPQTVLTELDKLKMSRSDREVKFRGREFSRVLFELSSYGSLTEGIELDNDSTVRVVTFDTTKDLPDTLNSKNADDRILASTWLLQEEQPGDKVVLVTNDLNMLLKAQTLNLDVSQHEYREKGFFKRLMDRLSGRRITVMWLFVPAMLAGILIVLWLFSIPSPIARDSNIFTPVSDPFQTYSTQELTLVNQIKQSPNNEQLWSQLGNVQLDWADSYQRENRVSEARVKYQDSLTSFQRALELNSLNIKARNSLGSIYYVLGNHDLALTEFKQVIKIDPNFSDAHFNIGVVLWRHRDLEGALNAFESYVEVDPAGSRAAEAKSAISEIKESLGKAT